MNTLYININGENTQSTENITVVGKPEDAIINKFYFELAKGIVKGVAVLGIGEVKKKSLVTDFESINKEAFAKIKEQWETVKQTLLSENPAGIQTIALPNEYIDWLKYHSNPIYNEIAKSLASRGNVVEISIERIYRNAITVLVNNIDLNKQYDRFVVNDDAAKENSRISADVREKIGFIPLEEFEKIVDNPIVTFDNIFGFSEGLSLVCVGEKYGYIDRYGKLVIPCIYDFASWFKEGVAPVCKEGKYGYIDKRGKQIIPFMFEEAHMFFEGLASVKIKGHWKFIDKDGIVKIDLDEDVDEGQFSVVAFQNGYACVMNKKGKWGSIDKVGKLIVPYKYDFPFSIDESGVFSCAVRYSNNWEVRSVHDMERMVAGYGRMDDFSEGLAACREDKKWGYINRFGIEQIEAKYEEAKRFVDAVAPVKLDGKWGFIDKHGTFVIPNTFDDAKEFSEGLAAVCVNDKWGFVSRKGVCIPFVFEWAESFSEGLARVEYEGKECIINKSGELVISNGISKPIVNEGNQGHRKYNETSQDEIIRVNWDDLFPVFGVTLGETDIDDIAERNNLRNEIEEEESKRHGYSFRKLILERKKRFVSLLQYNESNGVHSIMYGFPYKGKDTVFPKKWSESFGFELGSSSVVVENEIKKRGVEILKRKKDDADEDWQEWYVKTPDGKYIITMNFEGSDVFDKKDELDTIQITKGQCPYCESEDFEVSYKTNGPAMAVCNHCGKKWLIF